MNDQIQREEASHGTRWNSMHGGYFADPGIAAPLVRTVERLTAEHKPDTIADLGGGTGFLLSQLAATTTGPNVKLVNLDDSSAQLDTARNTGISCVHGSINAFTRNDLLPDDSRLLLMMRSVLHYLGRTGLRPTLAHLRNQARTGELFVHQTASFRRKQDADCLNDLYAMMRTEKWYPTVDLLRESLEAEGWHVLEILPAPALPLTDDSLAERYSLSESDRSQIHAELPRDTSVPDDVLQKRNGRFCAFLHYWIYVCMA